MDIDLITSVLQRMTDQFLENLPVIITAFLIILVGWGVARLVAWIAKRFVKRTGLNQAFESSDFAQELDKILPDRTLADLVSNVTFWLLWLYVIFSTLTTSSINVEKSPVSGLLRFLPHLFVAFLILVGGILLAQLIGRWVQVGLAAAGVEFHEALGKGTRLLLIVLVVITAIEELGISLAPLTNALTNIITIFVAGLALAFGVGARKAVRNVLAGYYAREHIELGDQVQIDGVLGTLDAIGTVCAEITVDDGRIVIPNSDLTDKMHKVK